MSFFQDVQAALDTRLSTLTGLPSVAWENTKFVPVRDTAWIRPVVLMTPSSLMELGDLQFNQGLYQIDLFYPLGDGAGVLMAKADDIYDHFKASQTLTSNGVEVYIKAISRATPAIREEAWFQASIEIAFTCYEN